MPRTVLKVMLHVKAKDEAEIRQSESLASHRTPGKGQVAFFWETLTPALSPERRGSRKMAGDNGCYPVGKGAFAGLHLGLKDGVCG